MHLSHTAIYTSKILLAEIAEQGTDLLVMGGYGHSRLREWVFGGVTYNLLRKAPVAIVVAAHRRLRLIARADRRRKRRTR